ncbi:MAG: hypothetical protein M9936_03885 [Caldilinea sp.]|nr:hypothetical protein [Caldilinea sp.]MCB0059624.1 hypothetical protein [Caldilineaceae bacterium]MCB0038866.1 hypothetical protein [Caldilinea sp.]MCB0050242.1 hypothetical protein [Caldilinea sp.]MCB0065987.1 hypothetical protein [Caldilineaceae bacterium]
MYYYPSFCSCADPEEELREHIEKRRELEEKFGVSFRIDLPEPTPEIDAFLDSINSFADALESDDRITLRAYLNNPKVLPPDALNDRRRLGEELDALIELLALHHVQIDVLYDVSDYELYRFIVEELFDELVADIRRPEMNLWFSYEEYHPNDEADTIMYTDIFLRHLLSRDSRISILTLGSNGFITGSGALLSQQQFRHLVRKFWGTYTVIYDIELLSPQSTVNGDEATVTALVAWTGLPRHSREPVRVSGRATFRLIRSADMGWDVIQARVPGVLGSLPGYIDPAF